MLSLIGLGLNDPDVTLRAVEAIKSADQGFCELFTNALDYDIEGLERRTGTRITRLDREEVEDEDLVVKEAMERDVAFLVSGDPLFATTHQGILFRARKHGIKTQVFHAPSVLNAVGETGLSMYKFGRITTLTEAYQGDVPGSVFEIVAKNRDMGLHSLILADMVLGFDEALDMVEPRVEDEVLVCSRLGTDDAEIMYEDLSAMGGMAVEKPFSFIIPGELSENERGRVERWRT